LEVMIRQLVIGILATCWGGGMLYYARAKEIPALVKPFVRAAWGSEGMNRMLCAILGAGTVVSGIVFIVAAIFGWDVLPLR
jgi:hypothetical protein